MKYNGESWREEERKSAQWKPQWKCLYNQWLILKRGYLNGGQSMKSKYWKWRKLEEKPRMENGGGWNWAKMKNEKAENIENWNEEMKREMKMWKKISKRKK